MHDPLQASGSFFSVAGSLASVTTDALSPPVLKPSACPWGAWSPSRALVAADVRLSTPGPDAFGFFDEFGHALQQRLEICEARRPLTWLRHRRRHGRSQSRCKKWSRCAAEVASRRRVSCDEYSRGTGFCTVNIRPSSQGESASLQSSNCVGRDFRRGVTPSPWFHCPMSAPLAVLLLPKSASTSVLNWVASLDGRRMRTYKEMVFVLNKSVEDFWFHFLRAPHASFGLPYEWLGGLMQETIRYKEQGLLSPPPHTCPTCCASGSNRQRVIFVRNPFSRLESAFRMLFLSRWSETRAQLSHQANFSAFVRMTVAAWRQPPVDAGFSEDGTTPLRRLDFKIGNREVSITLAEYDWAMIEAHLVSAAEVVGDERVPGRHAGSLISYAAVRLESLEVDLARLQERLCAERCYCRSLPPMKRLRSASTWAASAMTGRGSLWTPDARAAALLRYSQDFLAFGYFDDPKASRCPKDAACPET